MSQTLLPLRPLGRTGIRVPALCLGTMTFGLQCDEATSFAILDRAVEAGIDFWDTADAYPLGGTLETVGRTEELLGRYLVERKLRDRVVLATKCRMPVGAGPNDQGLSRYHIQRAAEASPRRLRTDTIDLYQVHALDPHTPIEETLRALDDLVRSGKVRYLGCSNFTAWRLALALGASTRHGLERFQTLQPRYNLLYREIETELLPLCRDQAVGVIVFNPLAGGLLTGKYRPGEAPRAGTRFTLGRSAAHDQGRYWHEEQLALAHEIAAAARARDQHPAAVAVAWVLAQPGITSAIVGASSPDQLVASIQGASLALDDELRAACDGAWWRLARRPVAEGYR